MLIAQWFLDELKAGRADLAFRRWPRARVSVGTHLRTSIVGLTESLEVGYRVSTRGRALLGAS